MSRHSTRGYVCDDVTVYDSGTKQFMVYHTRVQRKLQPVVRVTVVALAAFCLAVTLLGNTAPIPVESSLTAIAPVSVVVLPAPLPEPPVLTPALPERHRITVSRPLPTRVYPLVKQSVGDLPKEGKHHKAQKD